jgi:hypothetical protein
MNTTSAGGSGASSRRNRRLTVLSLSDICIGQLTQWVSLKRPSFFLYCLFLYVLFLSPNSGVCIDLSGFLNVLSALSLRSFWQAERMPPVGVLPEELLQRLITSLSEEGRLSNAVLMRLLNPNLFALSLDYSRQVSKIVLSILSPIAIHYALVFGGAFHCNSILLARLLGWSTGSCRLLILSYY